jgi:CelD/BcsL family acetyltransferase involved in cellulose biosynthesis
MTTMETSVVRPCELTCGELDAWRRLQRADPDQANPFLSPEFTMAVGRQDPRARVAVLREGPRPVGFFPFERHPLGVGKPIGYGHCDCQGLVHRAKLDWDPVSLLRGCGLLVWEFDHLTGGQWPFERSVTRRAASPIVEIRDDYASYVAYLRRRSPRFVRSMNAKERKLSELAGELRFVLHEPDPDVLATLMRWKSEQCQAKGRRDVFAPASMAALVYDLLGAHSDTCSAVLSALYAGDRMIACHFSLRSTAVLAYWFQAYDVEFAHFSPGLMMLLKLLQATVGKGIVDLGKGDDEYKDAVKTGQLTVSEGSVARGATVAALRRAQIASRARGVALITGNPLLRRAAVSTADAVDRLRHR